MTRLAREKLADQTGEVSGSWILANSPGFCAFSPGPEARLQVCEHLRFTTGVQYMGGGRLMRFLLRFCCAADSLGAWRSFS